MTKYKHIAGIALSAWSGLYVVGIEYGTDDIISFQYGYQSSDGMVYKPLQKRTIMCDPDTEEGQAYFQYKGMKLLLDECSIFNW